MELIQPKNIKGRPENTFAKLYKLSVYNDQNGIWDDDETIYTIPELCDKLKLSYVCIQNCIRNIASKKYRNKYKIINIHAGDPKKRYKVLKYDFEKNVWYDDPNIYNLNKLSEATGLSRGVVYRNSKGLNNVKGKRIFEVK